MVSCYRTTGEGRTSASEERRYREKHAIEQTAPTDDSLGAAHFAGYWNSDTFLSLGRIMQSYIGVPYKGGSEYVEGLDCSRLTAEVFEKFDGRKLPRSTRDQAELGDEIGRSNLQFGDLVFFKTSGSTISHVGIYCGDGSFLHASSSRGVVIDLLSQTYWRDSYFGARRIIRTGVSSLSARDGATSGISRVAR